MIRRAPGALSDNAGVDDFVIARNPEDDSTLPYLVRLPLGPEGVVLKVGNTWPRTAKVYAHAAVGWPDEPDVVERVAVRSCVRRGAAIDLLLDRGRENRSQFVFTWGRGREMIFWQSARTTRQARPNVTLPRRRASGRVLEILVDSHERYPWAFSAQQATTARRALPAGDYAVEAGDAVVAAVERKTLADLVTTLTTGKLRSVLTAPTSPARRWWSRTGGRRCSSSTGSDPRWWPKASPRRRSASRRCRSCSARPARWPRSGPTASSAPPSTTTSTTPAAPPARPRSTSASRSPPRPPPRAPSVPGPSPPASTSPTGDASAPTPSPPTTPPTHAERTDRRSPPARATGAQPRMWSGSELSDGIRPAVAAPVKGSVPA